MEKSKSKLKTMILGLDGATFNLIMPFIKENKLPTFAYLLKNGAWGNLESTIPPITAAAWTSFMTGKNPGKHGIISFTRNSRDMINNDEIVTTESFAGKTFFDVMSHRGMKIGVITVPVTYPPWDINGIMISGYPCPDNDKIYSVSKDISINIKEPLNFGAEYYKSSTEEQIIEDCIHRDRLRSELAMDLLRRYEFESFTLVFGGIDRSQHNYWKYYDQNYPGVSEKDREKFKDSILRNYKLADEEIAKFIDIYGGQTNFFIISDHGAMRHPFNFFNTNLWLKKNGWLQTIQYKTLMREISRKIYYSIQKVYSLKKKKISPSLTNLKNKSIRIKGNINGVFNWHKTLAYHYPLSFPTGGIMINLKGREANGIVNPGEEYNDLINAIIQGLSEYSNGKTGEKVIEKVLRREEVYNGQYIESFPDIIYILNQKYDSGREIFGSILSPIPKLRLSIISGLHSMNGILIAYGPQIKKGQINGSRIFDIAPTVLYSSGAPIPNDMDGVVLKDIFKEELLSHRPIEYYESNNQSKSGSISIEGLEDKQMKEKLRSLGYI